MFKPIYTGLEGKMTKKRYAVDYIMKLYKYIKFKFLVVRGTFKWDRSKLKIAEI